MPVFRGIALLLLLAATVSATRIEGEVMLTVELGRPSPGLSYTDFVHGESRSDPPCCEFPLSGPATDWSLAWLNSNDFFDGSTMFGGVQAKFIVDPEVTLFPMSQWIDNSWLRIENSADVAQSVSFDYSLFHYVLAEGPADAYLKAYGAMLLRDAGTDEWIPVPEMTVVSSVIEGQSDYTCSPACTGTLRIEIPANSYRDIRLFAKLEYAMNESAAVPEPATFALVGSLLVGCAFCRRRMGRIAAALAILVGLTCGAANKGIAAPIYQLTSSRHFGDSNGRDSSSPFNEADSSTFDELTVHYDDANIYDGRSAIFGTAAFETSTAIQVNQSLVSENPVGFLARNRVNFLDRVTLSGGAGTAYIVPVLHVIGDIQDLSGAMYANLLLCFGTDACVLQSLPNVNSQTGSQGIDTIWTPDPLLAPSVFQIAFGVPDRTYMFVETAVRTVSGQGASVPSGESVEAHFRFRLLGYKVFDANGNELTDVEVYSEALALPEPGSQWLAGAGLLALAIVARRRHPRGA